MTAPLISRSDATAGRLAGVTLPAGLAPFAGAAAQAPWLASREEKRGRKIARSLEDAIRACGLKNGMTISFHHAFREGDQTINTVIDTLAAMGLRDLTLAPSSLLACNFPLIEHIKSGVVRRIFTSGMRGKLADAISRGLMEEPIHIHSHGGRVNLMDRGEIAVDVAFLGVSTSDCFGNANAVTGLSRCGSLGYAMVDAARAKKVVLLAEQIAPYPNAPASIRQDQVDFVVKVDRIGDPSKISVGAARITSNPRELLIARLAADVMEHCGLFEDGFSMQTGTGGSATATARFLERKMRRKGITAAFALGGVTGSIVDLRRKGLVKRILDTQSFDSVAADSLGTDPEHIEISTNYYANLTSKGASVDQVDMVILSALEVDLDFNVNVITGSDGVMRGASGGHSDTAAGSNLSIVVGPLIRSRIPTVVRKCTTVVTPGETVGALVTDHGVAVNPNRPEVAARLKDAGLPVMGIEELYARGVALTGEPDPIAFADKVVGVVRYRDGSVIDVVRRVKG